MTGMNIEEVNLKEWKTKSIENFTSRPCEECYENNEIKTKMLEINNNTSTTELEEGKVMAVTNETIRKSEEVKLPSDLTSEDIEVDWRDELTRKENGSLNPTISNLKLILSNDPDLKGALAYDEFSRQQMLCRSIPWRHVDLSTSWTDIDVIQLRSYLEDNYGYLGNENKINDAVEIIMDGNKYHPIKKYLSNLNWDRRERINTVLIDYLGAEDNEYTKAVGRKWLIAAVARIINPGCKFDNMLILVGDQGIGKSQFFKQIVGNLEWFSDSVSKADSTRDAMEQLAGKWIIEFGELSAMARSKVEHIKAHLSRTTDSYRPAYGRRKIDFQRQCIFGGSTNSDEFLTDQTGNRRFWPVKVNNTDRMWNEMEPEIVDQIWAEALYCFESGEKLHLDPELEQLAIREQEKYTENDCKIGKIQEFLERKLPDNWDSMVIADKQGWLKNHEYNYSRGKKRDKISCLEIFCECFGGVRAKYKKEIGREYSAHLKKLGWTRLKDDRYRIVEYDQQRFYCRPTALPSVLESDLLDCKTNETVDAAGSEVIETDVQKTKVACSYPEYLLAPFRKKRISENSCHI